MGDETVGYETVDYDELQTNHRADGRRLMTMFSLAVAAVATFSAACCTVVTMMVIWMFNGNGEAERVEDSGAAVGSGTAPEPPAELFGRPTLPVFACFMLVTVGLILWITFERQQHLKKLGGSGVARQLGGRPADLQNPGRGERSFVNTVQEMAVAAGRRAPEVYVLDGEIGINAFNAGWTDETTVIGVTRGALETLSRDRLQALAAQSMAHFFHGDARSNLRLMAMVNGIAAIAIVGEDLVAASEAKPSKRRMGSLRRDDEMFVPGYVFGMLLRGIGWIGTASASQIQRAVATEHELLADATAVKLTGHPISMANVLRVVGGHSARGRVSNRNRRTYNHLFSVDSAGRFKGAVHPDIRERILRLDPSWTGSMIDAPSPWRSEARDSVPGTASASDDGMVQVDPNSPLAAIPVPMIGATQPQEPQVPIGANPAATEAFFASGPEAISEVVRAFAKTPRGGPVILMLAAQAQAGKTDLDRLVAQTEAAGFTDREAFMMLRPLQAEISMAANEHLPSLCAAIEIVPEAAHPAGFASAMAHLLEAVNANDLPGWVACQLLRSTYTTFDEPDRPKELQRCKSHLSVLVTLLAATGGGSSAIAGSVAGSAAGVGALNLRSKNSLKLVTVERAIDQLRRCDMDSRQRAVRGLVACVESDHRVDPLEAEVNVALASALHVPIGELAAVHAGAVMKKSPSVAEQFPS